MYAPAALLDIHARTHRCLATMFAHAAGFAAGELDRELPGFGATTLRLQLAHMLGAERYWIGVLDGIVDADEHEERLASLAELDAARLAIAAATRRRLESTTEAELDAPRDMESFGGTRAVLVPAHVVLRTMTHIFHHLGQCALMCRALGRPISGIDFPLR